MYHVNYWTHQRFYYQIEYCTRRGVTVECDCLYSKQAALDRKARIMRQWRYRPGPLRLEKPPIFWKLYLRDGATGEVLAIKDF